VSLRKDRSMTKGQNMRDIESILRGNGAEMPLVVKVFSLKAVLLRNGNVYPSIPVGYLSIL